MLKQIYALTILAHLVLSQDLSLEHEASNTDYAAEVVTEWTIGYAHDADLNQLCKEDCNRVCVPPCPDPVICTEDEKKCGDAPIPAGVWPDCTKDEICVDDDCTCIVNGDDGSACPLWCKTYCSDTEIWCDGGVDLNNCKEPDVCLDRPIGNDNKLCPGYCPSPCPEYQHPCGVPTIDGCPYPPTCEADDYDNGGGLCAHQTCPVYCTIDTFFCAGNQDEDGCYENDVCLPRGEADSGEYCDGHCPIMCEPHSEILCDGQTIYYGPKTGCYTAEQCNEKHRDVNGEFCPLNSDSHGCPLNCPPDHHKCPTRTHPDDCKEQQTCTPCSKDNEDNCCPPSSDCPPLCQYNEVPCPQGNEENGCKKADLCVVQERGFDGELCTVHCPGVCNDGQILCPGQRDENGCTMPWTCQPLSKKLWGDDTGGWCPGFCPAVCHDWEILCGSVQDPCDGCPTEQSCKPLAKDINGINCAVESASHGCAISCKTLDQIETICPSYPDPTTPGCKKALLCLPRSWANDPEDGMCPSHSVCPKECTSDEKQCADGYDDKGCKAEDLCVPYPLDNLGQQCTDFECPPACNHETELYCQGHFQANACPKQDYCVTRGTDGNGIRCTGNCEPECAAGEEAVARDGTDSRGCALSPICAPIV